jgi:DNA polymerase
VKLYIDLETRSRRDLKKVGVYRYSECPDFRILMCSYAWDDGPVSTIFSEADITALIEQAWEEEAWITAHNALFERVCLSRVCRPPGEFLWPTRFHDTMATAGEYGLPQSLDGAAQAVGAQRKDSAGSALIRLFCAPRRDGGWNDETTHPLEWLDFIAYCEQDVETLRDIDNKVGNFPTATEFGVWVADQIVNDTGMRVDLELCRLAVAAGEVNKEEAERGIAEASTIMNPRSVPQMMAWVAEQGLGDLLPNVQAATIEAALDSGVLTSDQQTVLELRADAALTSSGKFATALAVVNRDERIRGSFHFFGAHTGRWAGRGVQPQNLPRDHFEDEAHQEAAMLDLRMGLGASGKTLRKLVRPAFVGPFTVVDYASIEARVVAWLAGEVWALDAFRAGRDIYTETSERMSTPGRPLTRSQGKIAVLALGYNGAVNSLRAMGAEGTDDELVALVRQWRKANARIVRLWADLDNAIEDGAKIGQHLTLRRLGETMQLWLPSGRAIHYHGVKWGERNIYKYTEDGVERRTTDLKEARKWKEDGKEVKVEKKVSWSYRNPLGSGRIGTYGGRLTENVTQAVARDILAEALIRLLERGYTVAGHVHDEIIVEGEHDPEEIAAIMCEPPDWSEGLPIAAEGAVCQRYKKL